MRYSLAPLALAALAAANPVPQGVTSAISPSSTAGPDCQASVDGTFNIQVVNVTSSSKRSFQRRQEDDSTLTLTLEDGTLKDDQGRVGYIAANRQFQFDGPPQTGAIYTAGWAVCSNNTLVLGSEAVFQQCLSGDFYNIYDESTGEQCNPIYIDVINGGGSESQQTDGQVTGTAAAPVTQITDGQPQASTSAAPVTQISDGQIQASTSGAPVSQIGDGQIQASTSAAAPVTQIGDGQIQAPTSTGAPVTQIGDGQIQAPTSTGAPVTQISDGQIQAATTGAPVSQIGDGQVQAATSTGAPVSQISDGQIQAPTNGTVSYPSATIQPYTGAAATPVLRSELFGLAAAGIMAVAML